jgi:hypothetical protein
VRVFEGHTGPVHSVRISPDGHWAVSGGRWAGWTLRLWDVVTGDCVRELKGHSKSVFTVAISPDGRWALSGGEDKTLRLWELATGECVRMFEGHEENVRSVAISPDGRWALSGSRDNTVRLWELATGECVRVFEGHEEDVNAVAISPDGCRALSGSKDGTLRLWELVWDYEFPEPADWDEGARPYLQIFLTLHPSHREGLLGRKVIPSWTEVEFQRLLSDLQHRGYGWLRPEGVRRELEKMTRKWKGPPSLPWESQGIKK